MGLGLEQRLGLGQELRLQHTHRLELAQQMSGSISDIRVGGGSDPKSMLPDVVNRVISSVEPEAIKTALLKLFENGRLTALISEKMEGLAVLSKEKITNLAIEYVYKETSHISTKTNEVNLIRAYSNPDDVLKDIK